MLTLFALDLITDCMGVHLHASQLEFASSYSRRDQHRPPNLDIVFRGGGASDYTIRPIFQRPLLAKNHCPLACLRFCTALTGLFRGRPTGFYVSLTTDYDPLDSGGCLPCEVVSVLLVVATQTKQVATRYHAGNLRLNLCGWVFNFYHAIHLRRM